MGLWPTNVQSVGEIEFWFVFTTSSILTDIYSYLTRFVLKSSHFVMALNSNSFHPLTPGIWRAFDNLSRAREGPLPGGDALSKEILYFSFFFVVYF